MKQNNLAECKPRIEMGKMAGNGPGILALSSIERGGGRLMIVFSVFCLFY